jgi:YihY family inner membrane protein
MPSRPGSESATPRAARIGSGRLRYVLQHPWTFAVRVLRGFRANQGFLLAGAVAYYTLLSIVPMLALILISLSQLVEVQLLLDTTREYLVLVAPGQADKLTAQVGTFLRDWKLVGSLGLVMLLVFSSFAFTTLENAMSVIFFHRVAIHRRHFLVSAVIPYCYILCLALGMFLVSTVSGMLHGMQDESFTVFGYAWSLQGHDAGIIYLLGIAGEILLLSSLYLVMPIGRLAVHHALIGGITATVLWELTRHFMVWYFSTLSIVNVVYGTFATAVILLLSLEAAAVILLFGAQVISEYERIDTPTDAAHGLHT